MLQTFSSPILPERDIMSDGGEITAPPVVEKSESEITEVIDALIYIDIISCFLSELRGGVRSREM